MENASAQALSSPILLVHGLVGFRRLVGREYFAGIAQHLESLGHKVGLPVTHPTAKIETRAESLRTYLDSHHPNDRVHLIAHSMGGLDARYLASPGGLNQGHRIRSVTTLATPHHGSGLARLSVVLRLSWFISTVSRAVARWPGLDDESRRFFAAVPEGKGEGVNQLSRRHVRETFNPETPDHPDVLYRSYSGRTFGEDGGPADLQLLLPWCLLWLMEGANDGQVSVASARWGDWRGILPASHRDQVGHLWPREWIPFKRLEFYEKLVRELAELERA